MQQILLGRLASTEDSMMALEAYYPTESNLMIKSEKISEAAAMVNVTGISPVAEITGEAEATGGAPGYLTIKMVDDNYFKFSGTKPDLGQLPTAAQGGVVISDAALKLLNLAADQSSLGLPVKLTAYYQEEGMLDVTPVSTRESLKIIGIIKDDSESPFVVVPAASFNQRPPYYQRMFVRAGSLEAVEALRDALIQQGYLISAKIDLITQARQIFTVITIVLGIFGVTALIVSAIGMLNTMLIGFLERMYEVGIMKALGATKGDIRNLFLTESMAMGLAGGIGGILVGIGGGELLNFAINMLASHLGGNSIKLFYYPPEFMALILGVAVLVGVTAGIWPAIRAGRLSPKEAFVRK